MPDSKTSETSASAPDGPSSLRTGIEELQWSIDRAAETIHRLHRQREELRARVARLADELAESRAGSLQHHPAPSDQRLLDRLQSLERERTAVRERLGHLATALDTLDSQAAAAPPHGPEAPQPGDADDLR